MTVDQRAAHRLLCGVVLQAIKDFIALRRLGVISEFQLNPESVANGSARLKHAAVGYRTQAQVVDLIRFFEPNGDCERLLSVLGYEVGRQQVLNSIGEGGTTLERMLVE